MTKLHFINRRKVVFSGFSLLFTGAGLPYVKVFKTEFVVRVKVNVPAESPEEYDRLTAQLVGSELHQKYIKYITESEKVKKIHKRQLVKHAKNQWESTVLFHKQEDAQEFIAKVNPLLAKIRSHNFYAGEMTLTSESSLFTYQISNNRIELFDSELIQS